MTMGNESPLAEGERVGLAIESSVLDDGTYAQLGVEA